MDLRRGEFELLHQALLSAFPSVVALQMLTRMGLDENLDAIAGGSNLSEIVFRLMEWATAQGRLPELIETASQQNPGNSDLKRIAERLQWVTPENVARIQAYLRSFLAQIEDRLNEMLFLSAQETPDAIKRDPDPGILQYITLPPSFPSKSSQPLPGDSASQIFDNFSEAFATLGKQVLLLGTPGAGKTTTLLQFACTAARERMNSPDHPLPIFASIHRCDQKTPLSEWAHATLPKSLRHIRQEHHHLLYLFDGLDELGGVRQVDPRKPEGAQYDPRQVFLEAVEEQLPEASVVISCREQEYQEIGAKASLDGAVTLLPLETSQVESFLAARNQSVLWTALTADPNLLKLVRTPLLLALLSSAIGDEERAVALDSSQITASSIFDFYIKQRFAHEAVKRPLPFDEPTTRALMDKLAASMWENHWFPQTELKVTDVTKEIGAQASEFVEFLRSMHFLRSDSPLTIQFIHLKFRDYCAIPGLLEGLKDKRMYVRERAAFTLGQIGDAAAVPGLLVALRDTEMYVCGSAAFALGMIGVAAVPGLLEALRDKRMYVRERAAFILGQIGDAAAVSGLLVALRDTEMDVRGSAASALGKIGDAAAVSGLLEALRDTKMDVRGSAASALGQIGDVVAIPGLLEALRDTDDNVRRDVASALGQIGDVAAVPGLLEALRDTEMYVRGSAVFALVKVGVAAVPGLLEALRDTDGDVRRAVAYALKRIRALGGGGTEK